MKNEDFCRLSCRAEVYASGGGNPPLLSQGVPSVTLCLKRLQTSSDPVEIASEVRILVERFDEVAKRESPARRRRWFHFYRVKLLRLWRRSLRLNFRDKRCAAIDDYLAFVSQDRFSGLVFCLENVVFSSWTKVRRRWRWLVECLQMRRICHCGNNVRRRVLSAETSRKIRVLFLVTDISKWKCQSAYDLLAVSDAFTPFILIDLTQTEYGQDEVSRRVLYKQRLSFFVSRGMACLDGYDCERGREVDVATLTPDVFFYQQPWGFRKSLRPDRVGSFSLTCYVPYYVQNYSEPSLECGQRFHRALTYYMVMSERQAESYRAWIGDAPSVCTFIPVGHPMLDPFLCCPAKKGGVKGPVIYAPHWTFHVASHRTFCQYGTFEWSGEAILEFAKRHLEIPWCFKPHPLLRARLVESGYFSEEQASRYYSEWGKIGTVCLDADYVPIFQASRAMITDCGSFLTEYAVTGRPIIHLLSAYNTLSPAAGLDELYETFYRVHNSNELEDALEKLLVRGVDEQIVARQSALERTGFLAEGLSSRRIVTFLSERLARDGG